MDVLVISGGSSRMQFDERPVTCADIDEGARQDLVEAYPEQSAPAAELYVGREHEIVSRAVADLESVADVEWQLLSPGYGLVPADQELVAYECTNTDIDALRARAERLGLSPGERTHVETRQAVSRAIGVHDGIEAALGDDFDLVFLALSSTDFEAIAPALDRVAAGTTAIAIAADSATGSLGACHWLPATDRERRLLASDWVALRGDLLTRLVSGIENGDSLAKIRSDPSLAYLRSLGMA